MPQLASARSLAPRLLAVGALALTLLSVNPAIVSTAGPARAAAATATAATPASSTAGATAGATATQPAERTRAQRVAHRRAVLKIKTWRAFKIARQQKGDPYRYGGSGPGSFDCSGLTSYVYHRAGLDLPRTSSAQAGRVRHISRKHLRLGDLVFFHNGGRVYHVGLYAGRKHGREYVLHAGYSGTRVRTEAIWTGSWFGGTLRR